MAGDQMTFFLLFKEGLVSLADIHHVWTARIEPASRGGI